MAGVSKSKPRIRYATEELQATIISEGGSSNPDYEPGRLRPVTGTHSSSLTSRRSRPVIFYEILLAIRHFWASRGEARITPVQSHVNIPSSRFREFLRSMEKTGLVKLNPLDVTPAGNEYVEEFGRFLRFLEKYGLVPKESLTYHQPHVAQPHWAEIIAEYEKKIKANTN